MEYEQAKKFAQAFLRGQPRKATIATTLFRDKIDQLKGDFPTGLRCAAHRALAARLRRLTCGRGTRMFVSGSYGSMFRCYPPG